MHKISPFLWFDDDAEDAANLYVAVFNGKILEQRHWGPGGPGAEGSVMSVAFEIDGREFQAFNGGPGHPFSDSFSLFVTVDTQEELDNAWDRLIEGGGNPIECGWLRDRFGMFWQLVPAVFSELMNSPDPAVVGRVTQAMLSMVKLDAAALKAAAAG